MTYNGFCSREFIPRSGVPQGSNLGPLLFILFINDLLMQIKCPILAYADDIKIYTEISSDADIDNLQHNLDVFVAWCDRYRLQLNVEKCCSVSYTRSSSRNLQTYHIGNNILSSKVEIRDLGVTFDSALTFKSHINTMCSEACRSLGFIVRMSKHFHDVSLIKSLFFAYVLSKLEYTALVWYPLYTCDVLTIERINRRFLKFLSFKIDGIYPDRGTAQEELLSRHDMLSLESRRKFICERFLRRIMENAVDCSYILERMGLWVPRTSSRFCSTFAVPFARTNLLKRAPTYTLCRIGNSLDDMFL